MIACISPARSSLTETISTLRYASRAKKIRNKPIIVMDPREALIISLKREVEALQNENDHLRAALRLSADAIANGPSLSASRVHLNTPLKVDFDHLSQMEKSEMVELVKHYSNENNALRKENSELFAVRDLLIRDQELVCRENERLLKKLEDVNSVCIRSPIIPARPAASAEMLNSSFSSTDTEGSQIWINPNSQTTGSLQDLRSTQNLGRSAYSEDMRRSKIPLAIEKELDKRQIGVRNF